MPPAPRSSTPEAHCSEARSPRLLRLRLFTSLGVHEFPRLPPPPSHLPSFLPSFLPSAHFFPPSHLTRDASPSSHYAADAISFDELAKDLHVRRNYAHAVSNYPVQLLRYYLDSLPSRGLVLSLPIKRVTPAKCFLSHSCYREIMIRINDNESQLQHWRALPVHQTILIYFGCEKVFQPA
jgi:hypothetical protein